MNKIIGLLFSIGASLLVLIYIINSQNIQNFGENFFVVLPHHILTAEALDRNYKNIADKYPDIHTIVIISPNHFGSGVQFMESFKEEGQYCFANSIESIDTKKCIHGEGIGLYKYEEDDLFDLANYKDPQISFLGNKKYITSEHGIGEHFFYINKYLDEYKKVVPIVIESERNGNYYQTDELYKKIKSYDFGRGNTLFIASVDFSHHVFEKMAIFHDMATVEELNKDISVKAEVDCPNCLYLIKKLATDVGKNIFSLQERTSSSELMKFKLNYDNTSHIFGDFVSGDENKENEIKKKNIAYFDETFSYNQGRLTDSTNISGDQSGVYGVFFGDSHLTRGFDDNKSYPDKQKYFECFYQNKDTTKKTEYWKNTLFHGLDYVGLNLETAMCDVKNTIRSDKTVKFLTKPEYLTYFTDVGFNMFNLSNNHSYDYGNYCYEAGKKYLQEKDIAIFGEGRKDESEIFLSEKNGVKLAFMGINDTTYSWDIESKIGKIKQLTLDGYRVILNIHWGIEYQETNNIRQQKLAHSFVDAGADMIIGHHPHVVQNVETYKGVPIFYSLGNFIFDQRFKNTLKGYGVVYRIDNESLRYDLIEFTRKEKDFSIDCESWK